MQEKTVPGDPKVGSDKAHEETQKAAQAEHDAKELAGEETEGTDDTED